MMVKKGKKRARVTSLRQNVPANLQKKKIEKKTESDKKLKGGKTLLIAQEVKFARLLANNDKRVRDKVLKNLKKWLKMRSQSSFAFTETDFLRLWKGLFYCMWMSDKPLIQEDLAEALSGLVHCFNSKDIALLYTKCTLKSLATEWFGIDRYRVDKFEMLVRKIIRQTFVLCKNQAWNIEWVVGVGKVIEDILLDPKSCLGLKLHITELYMEELAKITEGNIPKNMVTEFVRPFVIYLASASDQRQMKHVVKNIFRYLIFQSDVGMDYTEKFHVWRDAGFPCQNIDEIQKIEVSDEDEDEDEEQEQEEEKIENTVHSKEKPLDPRAGRVDVEIPQIPFDPAEIVSILKKNKFHKSSTSKTRKNITRLIDDFTKLTKGSMPFGIKEIQIPEVTRANSYESAEQLLEFEKELYSDSSKNNRKRKRKGDLSILPEGVMDFEEVSSIKDSTEVIDVMSKKQKIIDDSISQNADEGNTKKMKLTNKAVKKVKKKSERLSISEPIPIKKSNKLNKSLSKSIVIAESVSAESSPTINSLDSSWNVDSVTAPTLPSSTISIKNKVLKTKKKNKVLKEKNFGNKSESQIPWLTPVLTRLEQQPKTPTPKKSTLKQTPTSTKLTTKATPTIDSAKKRVKIMLQKNTAQCTSEYFRQIRMSPAIPFDANRKPKAGVLKPSPLPSPVNPFYKKKILLKSK